MRRRAAAAASEQRRRSPPDSPSTARSSATPASSSSTTSRVAASAAHSWSACPPSTASRTVWRVVEVVALVRGSRPCSPRVRDDPPAVGLLAAGQHLQQRGLAVAVAADDADPLARADAEARRRSSSGRTPYALETRSRLTRLAISVVHHVRRRRPGPCADEYDAPVAGRRSSGRRRPRARGRRTRTGTRRSARSRTPARAGRRRRRRSTISAREVGPQVERGLLEVVVQRRGRAARVAAAQRRQQLVARVAGAGRRVAARSPS